MERTLIIIKPDGVQRGLVGEILSRFENKGMEIAGLKMLQIDKVLAEKHYAVHRNKPFYPHLIRFMTAAPVVLVALQGVNVVAVTRKMMGATFGPDAEPGTLRGDFGASKSFNLLHGSDSPATAEKELALFFKPAELLNYSRISQPWVYDEEDLA